MLPLTSIFAIWSSGLGFHVDARPDVVSTAARKLRSCPPILWKPPPTYSVLPDTASEKTLPSDCESQDVTIPVAASSAATPWRNCPSKVPLNVPPTKTVLPDSAMAPTLGTLG